MKIGKFAHKKRKTRMLYYNVAQSNVETDNFTIMPNLTSNNGYLLWIQTEHCANPSSAAVIPRIEIKDKPIFHSVVTTHPKELEKARAAHYDRGHYERPIRAIMLFTWCAFVLTMCTLVYLDWQRRRFDERHADLFPWPTTPNKTELTNATVVVAYR